MMDKLKQLDRKVLIIGGVILGCFVFVIILMVVLKMLSGPGNDYSKLESRISDAAEDYLEDNPDQVPERGSSITLSTDVLIEAGNLKELDSYINDTCSGSVTVMNNGGLSLFLPHVDCANYKTVHLSDKIIEDSYVENPEDKYQSGLYPQDGEFIFKGKYVNNYVSIGGLLWRIIKIDENGNLRLIKAENEADQTFWDNKYNDQSQDYDGWNDYAQSYLRKSLEDSYNAVKDSNKVHIIPHEVCVGKRASDNLTISLAIDCAEKLEGQYISIMNTVDYPMASLDENCKEIGSGSCTNYNYLYATVPATWTTIGIADNSYEVFAYSGGFKNILTADNSEYYSWIIYISGQELYTKGSGTEKDPYVIE